MAMTTVCLSLCRLPSSQTVYDRLGKGLPVATSSVLVYTKVYLLPSHIHKHPVVQALKHRLLLLQWEALGSGGDTLCVWHLFASPSTHTHTLPLSAKFTLGGSTFPPKQPTNQSYTLAYLSLTSTVTSSWWCSSDLWFIISTLVMLSLAESLDRPTFHHFCINEFLVVWNICAKQEKLIKTLSGEKQTLGEQQKADDRRLKGGRFVYSATWPACDWCAACTLAQFTIARRYRRNLRGARNVSVWEEK